MYENPGGTPNTPPAETNHPQSSEVPDIETLLSITEKIDVQLGEEITHRFGKGFYDTLRGRMGSLAASFLAKGDGTIDWVEAKGLPLPTSKAGIRVLSGVIGVTGSVVPGLGILLPLSYVLWQRSNAPTENILSAPTDLEKQYAQ